MRQYRGLTKDGKWVYGWYAEAENRYFIITKEAELMLDRYDPVRVYDITEATEVIPETVGQQVGFKDKNGTEIYKDDVMNFKTDKSSPSGGHYAGTVGFHPENARVVEWDKDQWFVGGFRLSTQLRMYEIIGNIHQNPELMENQND